MTEHPARVLINIVDPKTKRIILYVLGALASASVIAVGLIVTGTWDSERAQGASLLMNTFTLPSTKTDFVRNILSAAARVSPNLSLRSRALIAAWAAHESGWGKATNQARVAFNYWNLTAGGAWLGAGKPVLKGNDTEFTVGQAGAKKIVQQWRAYSSLDESVADLLNFIGQSGYINYREGSGQLLAGDEHFATALGVMERGPGGLVVRVDNRANTAGFYTMPRSEYQRSLSKLATEVSSIIASAQLSGVDLARQS